jgi:hypothetical protein
LHISFCNPFHACIVIWLHLNWCRIQSCSLYIWLKNRHVII